MMSALRTGKLLLTCGSGCRPSWDREVTTVSALNRAERWSDLALRIMQIGYGSDLAYFYLGQAAKGMGYYQAAIVYYVQARALADSSDVAMQCEAASRVDGCQAIRIADAAPASIALSRAALLREVTDDAAPAPVRPHRIKMKAALPVAAGSRPGGAADSDALRRVAGLARVTGLAQAIDTATLQVHGRTVPLAGVVGRPDAFAAQLQALIDAQGSTVHCVRTGSAYTCTLANGLNVARAALANGIATVAADASADFRAQQQAARAAHRGLWKSADLPG